MRIERPKPQRVLPEHAKKVFSGEVFDVFQWEQTLYDGSTTIFESLRRPDTVAVVPVTPEGKIVVLRQEQPTLAAFWCVPGGQLDAGEDPEVGAARELLEETGYAAETLLLWTAEQPLTKIDWALYLFVGRNARKVAAQHTDAGEKIDVHEVSFEEFLPMVLRPDFRTKELFDAVLLAQAEVEGREKLRNFLGAR